MEANIVEALMEVDFDSPIAITQTSGVGGTGMQIESNYIIFFFSNGKIMKHILFPYYSF